MQTLNKSIATGRLTIYGQTGRKTHALQTYVKKVSMSEDYKTGNATILDGHNDIRRLLAVHQHQTP